MGDPFEVLGLPATATKAEVRAARRRLAMHLHPDHGGDARRMQQVNEAYGAALAALGGSDPLATPLTEGSPEGERRVERDFPSFVIELLPVEAFEALLVATSWVGEVLVDDPPYLLEVHLHEPAPCWCRLELVPDAGASTVSMVVDGPVSAEDVRDLWVRTLNALGADGPGEDRR